MGGKSTAHAPTRYAGVQVQTSALGVQIPIVWGTARCKCNLVWYGDFKSKAQKASTGKGGGVTTGYSYSASLVLGVCEGPIADITSVWVNSKQYKGGNGVALHKAGLSMSPGAIGQSPWGYLTSKFPSQAIGYSGLCTVYASNYSLGESAATPNHAFEVVSTVRLSALGLPDAGPKDIVSDFFLNSRYGLPGWAPGLLDTASLTSWGNYCLAANLVLSPALDQSQTGSAFLTELFLATNSTCVWSEGVLKFIPYGDTQITGNGVTWSPSLTPVYSLDSSNFIPQSDGDDPLSIDLQDQSDAYNIVQIEYLDRANQYNTAIATAQDLANIGQYGRRKKPPTTVHSICTAAVAQVSAQLHLQRTLYVRAQYKFDLDWSFALLEPGDIVEITDLAAGLDAYPVRITAIEDDENLRRSITAEDLLAGVSHAPLYNNQESQGYVSDRGVDPGGVEANLLLWSEDFTQSVWAKADLAVTANAVVDPQFGVLAADRLVADTTNTGHAVSQTLAAPLSGVAYTFSAYLMSDGTFNGAQLRLGDGAGNNAYLDVDLGVGSVTAGPANSGTGTGADGGLVRIGTSNWYRVWVTCIFSAPPAVNAVIQLLDNSGNSTFAGDGVHGIYAWGAQVKQGVDVPQYAYTGASIAGPFLFNPPASLAGGPQSEACAAVAGGANWGGCNVWISADGTNYQQVGTIDQPARFGFLKNSMALVADPDTISSVLVDLGPSAGQLAGGTAGDADAATTLCLVDNELIAYESASLTAQGRYTLGSYIRRGLMGTQGAAHVASAPFVRMDDAVFAFPYIATQAGKQVYVKFQSFNIWGDGLQDLSVCQPYLLTLDPVGTAAGVVGGGNRVCFSDFDKRSDDGWFTGANPAGLAISRSASTWLGIPFNQMVATSTAAGQTISQKSIPFPVTGGERLSVSAGLQSFTGWTCHASIGFLDAAGAAIAQDQVGPTLTNAAFNTQVQGFVSVPANAVAAWFEAYATSTAAGQTVTFSLTRPMVTGAAAEQTTFPPYVKGPAAEYGADITGNWTAAAIVGQAPAATDPTVQSGATRNLYYFSATDPFGGGVVPAGAIWVQTGTPYTWAANSGTWALLGGSLQNGAVLVDSIGATSGAAASGAFTIPAGYPLPYVYVSLTAASGGASYAGSNANLGAGGGAAVSKIAVSPGDVINFTLGPRGANGTAAHLNGFDGSGSTATHTPSGMSLSCLGGGGAPDSPADATGTGGGASGGNYSNLTGSGNVSSVARITITASS